MVANALTLVEQKPSTITGIPRSIFTMQTEHLERMKLVAKMVASSSLAFGRNLNEGDAFLVMLKGAELGLEPMAALASIHVIQGMPTIAPQGMLALINRSAELADIVIIPEDTQCTVTMTRKDKSPHTEVFTLDDAHKLKLTDKDNWKKQARTMLKWRAVAACARVVFPDIIQGLYTQEEIGAEVNYSDSGDVIDIVPVTDVPDEPAKPETKPANDKPKDETPPHWVTVNGNTKHVEEATGMSAGQGAKLIGLKSPVDYAASMEEFITAVNLTKAKNAQTKNAQAKDEPADQDIPATSETGIQSFDEIVNTNAAKSSKKAKPSLSDAPDDDPKAPAPESK